MKIFKVLAYLLGSLILAALLFILTLPWLANTLSGKNFLISTLSHYISGQLEISHLQLSWTAHQKIEGFSLTDEKEHRFIRFDTLSLDAPLWRIILKSSDIGHVELKNLTADFAIPQHQITLQDVFVSADLFSNNKPLSLVAHGKTMENGLVGSFDITASLPVGHVRSWNEINSEVQKLLTLEKSRQAALTGQITNFPVALLDQFTTAPIAEILGDRLNLQLNKVAHAEDFLFTLKASSPIFEGHIKGKIQNDTLILEDDTPLRWKDTIQIAPLHVVMDPKKVVADITLSSPKTIPEVEVFLGKSLQLNIEADLSNLLAFKVGIKSDKLKVKATGNLSKNNQLNIADPIEIDYQITENLLQEYHSPLHLTIPSWMHFEVNPFTLNLKKIDFEKIALEGKAFIHQISLQNTAESPPLALNDLSLLWRLQGNNVDIDVQIDQMKAKTKLRFDKNLISSQPGKPAIEVYWTLLPEVARAFQSSFPEIVKKDIILNEPITLSGVISNLSIPLENPKKAHIEAHFTTSALVLKQQGKTALEPLFLSLDLDTQRLTEKINFKAKLLSKDQPDLITMNGVLNALSDLSFACQSKNFSMEWIKGVLELTPTTQKTLKTAIGNQLSFQIEGQLNKFQSTVNGSFNASHSNGSFGSKYKGGFITLTKPLIFEMPLTRGMADKDVPVLSHVIGSDQPLRVVIDPTDFRLPLAPFDMKNFNMGKGTVQLSKVYFQNQGEIKNLLGLLKPVPSENITIWFTPIYFDISKGILTLKRADLLVAQSYTLAAWGSIDLVSNSMNMTLGLTESALRYAFGIQGLDKDYMLRVPISSHQGKISLDYTRTAARISALVVQTQESLHAKLLGTLLDIATGDATGRIPAPTTSPFPWANEFQNRKEQKDQSSSKEKIKKVANEPEALIKDISKGASSLLNQLLK